MTEQPTTTELAKSIAERVFSAHRTQPFSLGILSTSYSAGEDVRYFIGDQEVTREAYEAAREEVDSCINGNRAQQRIQELEAEVAHLRAELAKREGVEPE